jgi:hypothetical protein
MAKNDYRLVAGARLRKGRGALGYLGLTTPATLPTERGEGVSVDYQMPRY